LVLIPDVEIRIKRHKGGKGGPDIIDPTVKVDGKSLGFVQRFKVEVLDNGYSELTVKFLVKNLKIVNEE